MKRDGFTVLEGLVAMCIIQVTVFGTLLLIQKMNVVNKGVRDSVNYALFRNQVMVFMQSDLVWKYTLNGAANTDMSCWLNQSDPALAPRNCVGSSGDLVLYDIKDVIKYDFRGPQAGLTPQGAKCNEFQSLPGQGNAACPMKFSLRWFAVCDPADAECVNPHIRIDGTFQFNGAKGQQAPPEGRLNFSSHHYLKFCPPKGPDGIWQDSGAAPAVALFTGQVISNNTGKVLSTGIAQWSELITPCRNVDILFRESMVTAPAAPAAVADTENRSRICLTDTTTNSCRFEFYREFVGGVRTFRLLYEGANVFTMPSFITLTDNSYLSIRVRQNRVDFVVDDRVLYTWYQKLTYPFRLQLQPASRAYSPQGFSGLQVAIRN